jgi:LuxR family maltose regulon positive regulatory protein
MGEAELGHDDLLTRGREALGRGAWSDARDSFERAVALSETPDALEGLGTAAWWQNDAPAVFEAREHAYRLYRRREDRTGAARMASALALDNVVFRGEEPVASGWLQRAHRLLDGLGPTPERAFLALTEGALSVVLRSDTEAARRLASEALEMGRGLGITDVEMLALALGGLVLVSGGAVEEGIRRLDEATTAATGGEMEDPLAIGFTCCYMMMACEQVRDYDRAAQWCERIKEFCRRTGLQLLLSFCRADYAAVLTSRGRWQEAEEELVSVVAEMRTHHPGIEVDGVTRLADLRRRQGRLDEAEEMFAAAEFHPRGLLGVAAVTLEREDHAAAVDRAERYLRRVPPENRTERAAGLEVLIRARAGLGDLGGARSASAEVRSLADAVGTPLLHAAADEAEGTILAAAGDHDRARRLLEDAVDRYGRSGAPFDAMRARMGLARSLAALGRTEDASGEARAALEVAHRLGAALDVERAEALLEQVENRGPVKATGPLTDREVEVLRLVAAGKTNRAIGDELVISEKTVARHVNNIFTKLGLSSRAAATAYAYENGLV